MQTWLSHLFIVSALFWSGNRIFIGSWNYRKFGWEGSFWAPAQSRARSEFRPGCSGLCPSACWKPPELQPLWAAWPTHYSALLKEKKFPFVSSMNVYWLSLWPLSLFLPPHSWERSGSISLITSLKGFGRLLLEPCLPQVLTLSMITQGKFFHCLHPEDLLLNTLSFVDVFLLIRGHKLNKVLWIWSNE